LDNITHTLAGLAMVRTGLGRRTRYGAAALVLGSNIPDVDIVTALAGRLAFIDAHRGLSHSLVGGCALAALVGTGLWALGRRRPQGEADAAAPRVHLGRLIGLALLAVLLHLGFDTLNDYGIRLLLPFLDRWYYGDIIFVVDPWFWLLLGAGAHLALKKGVVHESLAWGGWAVLSIPVLTDFSPPMPARVLWLLGLLVLGALRYLIPHPSPIWPRAAFGVLALYVLAVFGLHAQALDSAETAMRAREEEPGSRLAVIPRPADPFHWNVLYETPEQIVTGTVAAGERQAAFIEEQRYDKHLDDPVVRSILRDDPQGRVAARFCRYPFATITPEPGGATVSFRDARFVVRRRHEFSVFTVRVKL